MVYMENTEDKIKQRNETKTKRGNKTDIGRN
jgi:hypothetical protein